MTKSELIEALAAMQPQLDHKDVELAVKELLEQMSSAFTCPGFRDPGSSHKSILMRLNILEI